MMYGWTKSFKAAPFLALMALLAASFFILFCVFYPVRVYRRGKTLTGKMLGKTESSRLFASKITKKGGEGLGKY